MKYLIILLFISACEQTVKPTIEMKVSDACPVQIWINDELTYNEQLYNLVDYYSFVQEFKPTDKIRIQFTDEPGEDFFLVIKDKDGKFITQFPFDKTHDFPDYYLYDKTIIPLTDLGINDSVIKLEITRELDYILSNYLFEFDMSSWDLIRYDGEGFFGPFGWVYRASGGGAATFQFSNTYKSCEASQTFAEKATGIYKFSFQATWDNFDFPSYTIKYNISVYKGGELVQKITGQPKTTAPLSLFNLDTLAKINGSFDQIKLRVTLVEDIEAGTTSLPAPDLADATNIPFIPGGPDWTVGIPEPSVLVGAPNVYSDYLEVSPVIIDFETQGEFKKATIVLDVTTTYPIYILPSFLDGSDTEWGTDEQIINTSGLHTLVFDFDVAADVTKMRLLVFSQSESDGSEPVAQVVLKSLTPGIPSLGPVLNLESFVSRSILLAGKSDCLKVSDNIEDNTLIAYRGYKNCYGLVYDADDEDDIFYIRIPGLFFEERPIAKQKTIEVPGLVFNSAQSLKRQKRLVIFDGPAYWHMKIVSILAHSTAGFVQINSVDWTVEETYEDDGERPESYPMKGAKTWLTRKRYSKRVFT